MSRKRPSTAIPEPCTGMGECSVFYLFAVHSGSKTYTSTTCDTLRKVDAHAGSRYSLRSAATRSQRLAEKAARNGLLCRRCFPSDCRVSSTSLLSDSAQQAPLVQDALARSSQSWSAAFFSVAPNLNAPVLTPVFPDFTPFINIAYACLFGAMACFCFALRYSGMKIGPGFGPTRSPTPFRTCRAASHGELSHRRMPLPERTR
jgi:hypothetical protein